MSDFHTNYKPACILANERIAELTSECGVRANEASGFRTRIAELEAQNLDLCTVRDDEDTWRTERDEAEDELADCAKTCGGLEYRLERAEAENERLKNTIDNCSGPCNHDGAGRGQP